MGWRGVWGVSLLATLAVVVGLDTDKKGMPSVKLSGKSVALEPAGFLLAEETAGKAFKYILPKKIGLGSSPKSKMALGLMDVVEDVGEDVASTGIGSVPILVDPPSAGSTVPRAAEALAAASRLVEGTETQTPVVPLVESLPQEAIFKLLYDSDCQTQEQSSRSLVTVNSIDECRAECMKRECNAFTMDTINLISFPGSAQNCTIHLRHCFLAFSAGRTTYKNSLTTHHSKLTSDKPALVTAAEVVSSTLTASPSPSGSPSPSISTSVTNMLPLSPSASPSSSPTVSHPTKEMPSLDLPSVLNLTIVSPTVRRFAQDGSPAPEWYLQPMVERLWNDLSPASQRMVNFLILNSDKEPSKHVEAVSLTNHPGVTVLNKPNYGELYGSLDEFLHETGALNGDKAYLEDGREVNPEWLNWVAAEDLDGAYLLEKAMNMSPYVLFLEDDVQPTRRALEKLSQFVTDFEHDDWLFIDLYTPDLDWVEGGLDVRNGERYNFFCCTQAMLFRSDMLPGIIRYWRTHASEPVDDNLRNYRQEFVPNKFIYAMRPNLFEHVGAYSSNYQKSTGVVEHQSLDFVP